MMMIIELSKIIIFAITRMVLTNDNDNDDDDDDDDDENFCSCEICSDK